MPKNRKYLPYGLTKEEKENPKLLKLLRKCIKKVEIKQCPLGFENYDECKVNPVAVCRASLEKKK